MARGNGGILEGAMMICADGIAWHHAIFSDLLYCSPNWSVTVSLCTEREGWLRFGFGKR